jgi:hypothetical protein
LPTIFSVLYTIFPGQKEGVSEDLSSFLETHAMLALVLEIFCRIPFELEVAHSSIVIHICKYFELYPRLLISGL